MNILKLFFMTCIIQQVRSKCQSAKKIYDAINSPTLFAEYVRKFDKKYTGSEYDRRLRYFKKNLKFINKLNKGNRSAVFGITSFSDMSRREMKKLRKKRGLNDLKASTKKVLYRNKTKLRDQNIPQNWDWLEHGAVTMAENQGECGCCWAFSAAGAVEGRYAAKNGVLKPLSIQQLLDCCTEENTCDGGFPEEALRMITEFGGLVSKNIYHYEERKRECRQWNKNIEIETDGADIVYVPTEDHLKHLIYTHGPIAAGMKTGDAFFYYKNGLVTGDDLQCNDAKALSHAVLITGYGGAPGQEYWIVKNSFGRHWGHAGFFYLARNLKPGVSQCAITEYLVQAHVL